MNAVPDAEADLTQCDREPIARLDRIQSFGFLLAMSTDWTVSRASSNLKAFLGLEAEQVLGAKLDSLIDVDTLHDVRNRMAFLNSTQGVERLYGMPLIAGQGLFDVAIHYSESFFVLEGEPSGSDDKTDAVSLVRAMMARLSTSRAFDDFHNHAVRQISSMTGFGRVMIYRFDEDGAGEVIAEATSFDSASYLGLHYPASDIPLQARALYLKNPFRIIADVDAPTARLLPTVGGPVQPLDLSLAMTRSVSPVHIEYLRNMRVAASMSISIVVDGKLWGLIACHHGTALLPSFVSRTAAELFGQLYSLTLESWLRRSMGDIDQESRMSVDRIIMSVAGNIALLTNPRWLQESLKTLIRCDGVATLTDDMLSVSGQVPPGDAIRSIADRLKAAPAAGIFTTDHLAASDPNAGTYASTAAGILVIPISKVPRDYILLFRVEIVQDIRWAGNPENSMTTSGPELRLSPRKSFDTYVRTVRGRSRPFTNQETRAAEAVRSGLIEVILQFTSSVEVERKHAAARQEVLIAELNHRVRNILALIRGLISQTNVDTDEPAVAAYIQSLNGRVLAIARAHDEITRHYWEPGSLRSLLNGEMAVYSNDSQRRYTLVGLDVMLQPLAYSTLSLVVHELVTNAVKYGSLSTAGHVTVTLDHQEGSGLRMKWRESGGPTVKPPVRRGFGSVIIERIVPFDLQGSAEVQYSPDGLEADLFIPESHIAAKLAEIADDGIDPGGPAEIEGMAPSDLPNIAPLLGLTVLLLEDNMIVALEGERVLRELGAGAIFTAPSIAFAERIVSVERIDFALLDINIGLQTSFEFSKKLKAAAVPFAFASGYGDNIHLGIATSASIVSKPYTRDTLGIAVAAALRLMRSDPS